MRGAQEAAWSAGYAVALVDVPLDRPLEAPLEALRAGPADGFIYFSVEPPERRPGGERIVVIEAEPEGLPWVALDTAGGTDAALAHLIELGHRRIGQLGSRVQYPTFQIRMARWRAALESVGVEPSADARAGSRFDFDDAAAAAGELLDAADPPTAIICDDDILAGRRVPRGPLARAPDPRGPVGRRVRRPAVRARPVAAAHDRERRRRAAGRRRLRGAGRGDGGRRGGGADAPGGAGRPRVHRPRRATATALGGRRRLAAGPRPTSSGGSFPTRNYLPLGPCRICSYVLQSIV